MRLLQVHNCKHSGLELAVHCFLVNELNILQVVRRVVLQARLTFHRLRGKSKSGYPLYLVLVQVCQNAGAWLFSN